MTEEVKPTKAPEFTERRPSVRRSWIVGLVLLCVVLAGSQLWAYWDERANRLVESARLARLDQKERNTALDSEETVVPLKAAGPLWLSDNAKDPIEAATTTAPSEPASQRNPLSGPSRRQSSVEYAPESLLPKGTAADRDQRKVSSDSFREPSATERSSAAREFDNEQRTFEAEINNLRQRISKLEAKLKRRAKNRERLINRKMKQEKRAPANLSASNTGPIPRTGVTLAVFVAEYSAPCRAIQPTLDNLKRKGLPVVVIESTQDPDLIREYTISELPTFILLQNGIEVWRESGKQHAAKLEQRFRGVLQSDGADTYPKELPGSTPNTIGGNERGSDAMRSESASDLGYPSQTPRRQLNSGGQEYEVPMREDTPPTSDSPFQEPRPVEADNGLEPASTPSVLPEPSVNEPPPISNDQFRGGDNIRADDGFGDLTESFPTDAGDFVATPSTTPTAPPVPNNTTWVQQLHGRYRDIQRQLKTDTPSAAQKKLKEEQKTIAKLAAVQVQEIEAALVQARQQLGKINEAISQLKDAGISDNTVSGLKQSRDALTFQCVSIQRQIESVKAPFFERKVTLISEDVSLEELIKSLTDQTGIVFRPGIPSTLEPGALQIEGPGNLFGGTSFEGDLQQVLTSTLKPAKLTHRKEIDPRTGELICVIVRSDFKFEKTPLGDVLMTLAQAMGVGYEASGIDLKQPVTGDWGTDPREALKRMLWSLKLSYSIEKSDGMLGGETFKIYDPRPERDSAGVEQSAVNSRDTDFHAPVRARGDAAVDGIDFDKLHSNGSGQDKPTDK